MKTKSLSWDERRERRKAMADAVRGGSTIGQAARAFGVTIESVRRACQEHDVETPDGRGKFDRNATTAA